LIFIEFSPWCLDSDLIGGFMPPSTDGSWRLLQSYGPLANVTALGSLANDGLGLDGGLDHRHGRQGSARFLLGAGPDQPEQAIDADRSSLTVHVGRAGLISAAAHKHCVNAPIAGEPIKIGGGVVRVKDELEISFRVYTASR
jgi:hypothetical protein